MPEHMIEHIKSTMNSLNFPCEWRIEWFKQRKAIQLSILFPVRTDPLNIVDAFDNISKDGNFVFEAAILLNDTHQNNTLGNDFMVTIPFDAERGMEGGMIFAILKTLRLIAEEIRGELNNFMVDENAEVLAAKWNNENYRTTLQTLMDTHRYDTTIYLYPKE